MNWKDILGKLVESFACCDPIVYGYYVAAKREAAAQVETAQDQADERELIRLVERLQSRTQASA
jgi:hypothetical protein